MNTVSVTPSLMSAVASLPQFYTARDAVMFVLSMIPKSHEGAIRIYLSKDISKEVTTLLAKLGVRFKTVPAKDRIPPYLSIDVVEKNVVITVVDKDGHILKEIKVERNKFFAEFVNILKKILKAKSAPKKKTEEKEAYQEVIIDSDDVAKLFEEVMDME